MFVRPCYRKKDGKRHAYWVLVVSCLTERGPRQRVGNCIQFGGPWLALELIKKIGLDDFLPRLPANQSDVRWPSVALILVICRLGKSSSELHIAEHFYRDTALE